MSELSFLLELLLSHKLAKGTKEAITDRIKEVERRLVQPQQPNVPMSGPQAVRPARSAQSPSTQRILDEMAAEGASLIQPNPVSPESPGIPAQIAQTPAAALALAARQEAINIAVSGKEERGRTSPRKF